jgi:lipid-binding SYLF domain-containing protein
MPKTLAGLVSRAFSLAEKELDVLSELHGEAQAALLRMKAENAGLAGALSGAYAYAIFPSVGSAGAVVGAAFGKGEVFRRHKLVGYAAVARLTVGVQLGGQTFRQLLLFENKQAFDRFRAGRTALAASASAVLLKAGDATSARYEKGVAVYVHSDGGMMLEAAIGGQRLFFRPAVLGRGRSAVTEETTSAGQTRAASTPSLRKASRTRGRKRASTVAASHVTRRTKKVRNA